MPWLSEHARAPAKPDREKPDTEVAFSLLSTHDHRSGRQTPLQRRLPGVDRRGGIRPIPGRHFRTAGQLDLAAVRPADAPTVFRRVGHQRPDDVCSRRATRASVSAARNWTSWPAGSIWSCPTAATTSRPTPGGLSKKPGTNISSAKRKKMEAVEARNIQAMLANARRLMGRRGEGDEPLAVGVASLGSRSDVSRMAPAVYDAKCPRPLASLSCWSGLDRCRPVTGFEFRDPRIWQSNLELARASACCMFLTGNSIGPIAGGGSDALEQGTGAEGTAVVPAAAARLSFRAVAERNWMPTAIWPRIRTTIASRPPHFLMLRPVASRTVRPRHWHAQPSTVVIRQTRRLAGDVRPRANRTTNDLGGKSTSDARSRSTKW